MAASVDLIAFGRRKSRRKAWLVFGLLVLAAAPFAVRRLDPSAFGGPVSSIGPASGEFAGSDDPTPAESFDSPRSQDFSLETAGFSAGFSTDARADASPDPGRGAARELHEWLYDVAQEAGLGVVIADGVAGRPAARFPKNFAWRPKLDALSAAAGFSYEVRDGLIEVFKRDDSPPDGLPPGDSPPLSAAQSRRADADRSSAATSSKVEVRRLSNARARDIAGVVEGSFAGRGLSATADEASNALVLSGSDELIAEGFELVDSLDVARRRFLLEARIVEMLSATRSELGIQWRLESGDFGAVANFPASESAGGDRSEITVATAGTTSLRARLSALEADGKVRVIARPRVLVVEGRPALIESVRILRVRLPDRSAIVADADDVVAPDAGRAVEEFPVGISLRVEPSLLGGGEVALRIAAKSSTLGEPLPPDDIPEEFSRLVEADIVVADGRTAVLGGLSRVGRSRAGAGVPVLRDIPWVGRLFGRRAEERDREELLVLVTPRLLR